MPLPRRVVSKRLRLMIYALIALCVGGFIAGVMSQATYLRRHIETVVTTDTDSAQWAMTQADVDMLALMLEMHAALNGKHSLTDLRRRHDVLHARINMITSSPLFGVLHDNAAFKSSIGAITSGLTSLARAFDGDDAALRAALPDLLRETEEIRPVLRNLTVSSQQRLANEADDRRRSTAEALLRMGALAAALIGVLASMVLVLIRMDRRTRHHAHRQQIAQTRMRAIIAASFDAMMVIDLKGRILGCNEAAETMFGYTSTQLRGRRAAGLISTPLRDEMMREGLPPPGTHNAQVMGMRRDGTRFPAACSLVESQNLSEKGDQIEQIRICFLQDISDRVAAEKALTEARDRAVQGEKVKAEMLAVMSHEMRTPLNGIMGMLDLLRDTDLDARQKEYLRVMQGSSELLLSHVNNVLDISRLDASRMPLSVSQFNLNGLLNETIAEIRPVAEANGVRLSITHGPRELDLVQGDRMKLHQVVLNLLGNAVKFSPEGQVSLETRLGHDGHVSISISDTGIGIAGDDIERIFDEFVTLDSSYGRKVHGTGLGLPISRRLMQLMGGSISVSSTPGRGSTFTLDLPVQIIAERRMMIDEQDALTAEPAAPATGQSPTRALQVLIVEDNAVNRFVLGSMLTGEGHSYDEAVNGLEGIAKAETRHYDLILMDISMPELDGVKATQRIRAGHGPCRDVPIIAVTAHAQPADQQRFQAAGMTDTLTKPLSRNMLREVMQRAANPATGPAPVARAPAPPPEPGLIDDTQLDSLRANLDPAAMQGLISRLVEDTEEGLAMINNVAAANPLDPQVITIAHSLAGSAAVFGLRALRTVLVRLEDAGRAGQADEVIRLIEVVNAGWSMTLDSLERRMDGRQIKAG